MIIQNGQNRNLAICNARQVVMLRGGQWIIEFSPVLSSAVKSQIYEDIVTTGHHSASLAAEVWRAANLYCKSHAASHPELTAQGKLLSAFVNADKDMYCSLPLALTPAAQSALPTRWLINGGGYIDTMINGNANVKVYSDLKFGSLSSASKVCISNGTDVAQWFGQNSNQFAIGASYLYGDARNRKQFTITWNNRVQTCVDNEGRTGSRTATSAASRTFYFSGEPSYSANDVYTVLGVFRDYATNNVLRYYIPNKLTTNEIVWIDIENLTLYHNAGSGTFTEQKDIPNS